MKTAKEWKQWYDNNWTKGITLEGTIHTIQKEAYNQAIEDAVENAQYTGGGYCINQKYEPHTPIGIDKESILKLKK